MMGRMTLQEVRKALAAAKAKKESKETVPPIVRELESLAQLLEREVEAETPAKKPSKAETNGRGRGSSRRSARSRGPRRR